MPPRTVDDRDSLADLRAAQKAAAAEAAAESGTRIIRKAERASEMIYTPVDETGAELAPVMTADLPDWPTDELHAFPFFAPVDGDGAPLPWICAAGPRGGLSLEAGIDQRSGVYIIMDRDASAVYVGSSTGTSKQGNVRRTLARHWQRWERAGNTSGRGAFKTAAPGGITVDRRDVIVCVLLVPNELVIPPSVLMRRADGKPPEGANILAPRQIESWYQLALRHHFDLLGLARLVEFDSPDVPF